MHDFTRELGLGHGTRVIDETEVEGKVIRSGEVISPADMKRI